MEDVYNTNLGSVGKLLHSTIYIIVKRRIIQCGKLTMENIKADPQNIDNVFLISLIFKMLCFNRMV